MLKEQWLDAAVLRILERPSLSVIFKRSAPHNQLPILASMPTVVWMIRKEYARIADAACAERVTRIGPGGLTWTYGRGAAWGKLTDPRSNAQ